jgi:hypothetical protein
MKQKRTHFLTKKELNIMNKEFTVMQVVPDGDRSEPKEIGGGLNLNEVAQIQKLVEDMGKNCEGGSEGATG